MLKHLTAVIAALALALPLSAAELGDDGLHKADWIRDTFLDLREDFEEAQAEGKRFVVMVEQRGCIYCTKMHEEVYSHPDVEALLTDDFFVVRLNMFGDLEVVDFDGTILSEKDMVRSWGLNFTPTTLFYPAEMPGELSGPRAAASVMPGAFGRSTTYDMLNWVLQEGYDGDEVFQKYHARMINERRANQ